MGIVLKRGLLILHIILLFCLGVGVFYCYSSIKEVFKTQETLVYYVNISGKQRVLAQRIVFLSQVVSTNYILKHNNHEEIAELRSCISQLTNIHSILQNFVVSMVVTNYKNSTLDDIYFGSGNLSVKMENFLNSANKIFFINNVSEILVNNQELLNGLEGDNGLLASLELATLSQQFYAQNQLKEMYKQIEYFLLLVVCFIILEAILFLIIPKNQIFKNEYKEGK